jgi:hypothetical protein
MGNWFPGQILRVQSLADNMDVCLLSHLLGREQAKLQVASKNEFCMLKVEK